MKLAGRRIVVTGAARGIGRAIARACAGEGAVVGVGFDTSEDAARALAAELPGALALPIDVRDGASIEAAVERFCANGRLDGWVNNAGLVRPGLLVTAAPEAIAAQIAVNLTGAVLCARAALAPMLRQRAGVILNIGSVAAARPVRGQAAYAAAKAGLEGLTRALAVEVARKGIRVCCLRPGPVETEMLEATRALAGDQLTARIPLGRLGQPEEIARLAVLLLGDDAAFATGATFTLDGGYQLG